MTKISTWAAGLALLSAQAAIAQTPPQLGTAMFDESWAVVEVAGNAVRGYPLFINFTDGTVVRGKTPCATGWSGSLHLNLPGIHVSNVRATTDNCPKQNEVTEFLQAVEGVRAARTGDDGLELLDSSGKRVLLLVQGG